MKTQTSVLAVCLFSSLMLACQSVPKTPDRLSISKFLSSRDDDHLISKGEELSVTEMQQAQVQLQNHPDDWSTRLLLLGYFWNHQYDNPADEKTHSEMAKWLITNKFDKPIAGDAAVFVHPTEWGHKEIAELWIRLVKANPRNDIVLNNALNFSKLSSDDHRAEDLAKQALLTSPDPLHFHHELFRIYNLESGTCEPVEGPSSMAKATAELQILKAGVLNPHERTELLGREVALYAYLNGDLAGAEAEASALLKLAESNKQDLAYSTNTHHAHQILGLVSLKKGDLVGAKDHLMASINVGDKSFSAFGPNMCLAKHLLEMKETAAVNAYLDRIDKVWLDHEKQTTKWRQQIAEGKIPDFKANLEY